MKGLRKFAQGMAVASALTASSAYAESTESPEPTEKNTHCIEAIKGISAGFALSVLCIGGAHVLTKDSDPHQVSDFFM